MSLTQQLYRRVADALLSRNLCYLASDGQCYGVIPAADGACRLSRRALAAPRRVVIVARARTLEQSADYPVPNRADLLKILAAEHQPPENLCWVVHQAERTSRVNCYHMQLTAAVVSSAWLVLPEVLLLGLTLKPGQVVEVHAAEGNWYAAVTPTGLRSARCLGVVTSAEAFALSVGLAAPGITPLSAPAAAPKPGFNSAAAVDATAAAPPAPEPAWPPLTRTWRAGLWRMFTARNGWRFNPQPLARWPGALARQLGAFVLVGLLYLAVSSAWLLWQERDSSARVAGMRGQISTLLTRQQVASTQAQLLDGRRRVLAPPGSALSVWPLLAQYLTDTIWLTNVSYTSGVFTLRGSAASATDFLQRLRRDPNVVKARFNAPVARQNNKERFVITFKTRRGG